MVDVECLISSWNTGKSKSFNSFANYYILKCFNLFDRDQIEWNQISNNVKPGGNFVVLDLEPASWYKFKLIASQYYEY